MIVGVVNGSAKGKRSNSQRFLNEIKRYFKEEDIREFYFNTPTVKEEDLNKIKESDVLVLGFGLYTDGIPSHLLNCLKALEEEKIEKDIKIYVICNCGFYEGNQCETALEIMKNWCSRLGFSWQGGIGIGASETLLDKPDAAALEKKAAMALKELAGNISKGISYERTFLNPDFPKSLFVLFGNLMWRKVLKKNGIK